MKYYLNGILKENFWVVAYGSDCDGNNRGRVDSFKSYSEAESFCNEMNEWSDGLMFVVVNEINDLRNYCYDFDLDHEPFL